MSKTSQLSNAEIAAFCRQMGLLYKGGITPADGINILISDTISEDGKALLAKIGESCRYNKLYQALEETGVFPNYVIKLLALGESLGQTENVLNALADFYEREQEVSEGIRQAVTYPLIMIAMMFLIIIVLIVKVLPIFRQVFVQLGTEMSPLAEKLMGIGNVLSKYAIGITIGLFAIILAVILLIRIPAVKKAFRKVLSKIPFTKTFYTNIATARFASAMYLGINSGMDTFENLEMASEIVENEEMQDKIKIMTEAIRNHSTLSEAIGEARIFSSLYTKMIDIGERAGSKDEIMKQIADHYDETTNKQLRKILSIIEPTLVIVLSLIVGIILLSVLLPLMGIMSSIG